MKKNLQFKKLFGLLTFDGKSLEKEPGINI